MKILRFISILLLLIVAINALAAGYSFMAEPSGAGLKISIDFLRFSPFKDFFIPGLVLFVINGLFNIAAALVTLFKIKNHQWVIVFQGAVLVLWIIMQILMLQQINFLHYLLATIGISLILFGILINRNLKHE